jgi:hypothetical protein
MKTSSWCGSDLVINGDRSKLKLTEKCVRTFEIFPIAWKCLWGYVLRSVDAKLEFVIFTSTYIDSHGGHFFPIYPAQITRKLL